MRYLTIEQVLFLHHRVVAEFGGSHGIRDLGLLESAMGRPHTGFGGQELFEGIFAKAAALMDGIIRNHPFVDGNKRTAITAAGVFLSMNGFFLTASNDELEEFTVQTAVTKPTIDEIADWFESNSKSTPIQK